MKCGDNYSTPGCLGSLGSGRGSESEPVRESENAANGKPSGHRLQRRVPGSSRGAEGQNSDFRVWICEEEGVVKGSWRCRGRGREEGGLQLGRTPVCVPKFRTATAGCSENLVPVRISGGGALSKLSPHLALVYCLDSMEPAESWGVGRRGSGPPKI